MKHIRTIHVLGVICVVDLFFGSGGVVTFGILGGYAAYRLEKREEEKKPEPYDIHPIPKQPREELPLGPDPFDRGNSNIKADTKN